MNLESGWCSLKYTIITEGPDSRISLRVAGLKLEDKDLEAKVTFEKGLVPDGGEWHQRSYWRTKCSFLLLITLPLMMYRAEHDG